MQLAISLFHNNELDAAQDQFEKLRIEPLSAQTQQVISQYLDAIQQQNRWNVHFALTYLNDPNVNNAPKSGTQIGDWHAPKRESATGIGLSFELDKKWGVKNQLFSELRLTGNSKYYWNNKKYNEATGRISLGGGYQNARTTFALLPFMEQSFYAGGNEKSESLKRFSQASGATLEHSYWLSPQFQLSSTYEYAENRYRTRKHLNGNTHFIGSQLIFLANPKTFFFISADYNRTSTRDKDDSYLRKGIRLGWGQEWMGVSTRLVLNYAHKNYKAPMPIFNITQRNKELGFSLSLWHRAVHFYGITPRLTYHYQKVKSNHAFYSYDKSRLFLEFSKKF